MTWRRTTALVLVSLIITSCVTSCAGADRAGAPIAEDPAAEDPAVVDAGVLDAFAGENGLGPLAKERVQVLRAGREETLLEVDVLVADRPDARARGLSRVAELPDGVGMLFVFTEPSGPAGRPGFWMLETLVPLDIAFVADGAVVGVATMQPCTTRPCPITHPGVDYDSALEVAAGVLTAAGVVPGDRVHRPGDGARG